MIDLEAEVLDVSVGEAQESTLVPRVKDHREHPPKEST